ncbi:MAG TPA: TadE family protein [Candidatus Dormibacteraeota bacterium]|jgi:hypothetical protein
MPPAETSLDLSLLTRLQRGPDDPEVRRTARQQSRHGRRPQGQSLVEFAVVFPLFVLILAVASTGSQYLSSVIGLTGAVRAGAIAASNDVSANSAVALTQELADATAAINYEEGCVGCYVASPTTGASACGAGQSCVWITRSTAPAPLNTPMEVVHVSHPVVPLIPLLKGITVQSQAGATP